LLTPSQPNNTLYLILRGKVRVQLDGENPEALASLGAGHCVGEMSIIEGRYPSATVITASQCRMLCLDGSVLWSLINRSHAVARNLLFVLSTRVRKDNKLISQSLQQQKVYEQNSKVDTLTGLYNRRWLDEMLPRMTDRCSKSDQALSVLMIDVDHFKHYNDTHGHMAGDRALITVAQTIQSHIRAADTAVRYGGEEILVVMPGTDAGEAGLTARRLRKAVEQEPVRTTNGRLPGVTVSIGVATLYTGQELQELLETADEALYRAKRGGRNRVSD